MAASFLCLLRFFLLRAALGGSLLLCNIVYHGLEFAGAHAISGNGMGPAVTNGRAAAKAVIDDVAKKKAASEGGRKKKAKKA